VTALLQVAGLRAGYADGTVLHGVDLTVEQGRAVALLGRNGAGKSTLLAAVMGLLRPTAGTVSLQGRDLAGRPAHQVARAGVALVPQGRRVFADSPSTRTSRSPPAAAPPASGHRPGPTSSSPSSPSAAATAPTSSRAASSRCSPSPGPCC